MLKTKNLYVTQPTISDIDQIYEIEIENFLFPWSKHYFIFNLQLSDEFRKFYVAKVNEEIVGYVICWISDKNAHIHNLSVKKLWQRLGVGSKLLEFLFKNLKDCGVRVVTLEVRVSNVAAINLYKKFGFEVVTVKHKFYDDGEDAFFMVKNL